MFSKAHLTSHYRMSGSRWVITPSWLSGSSRSFSYSSSVYSCHVFLISSVSVRSLPFLSFIVPVFVWNVPLLSLIFLNGSLVFPILSCSSVSLHWSLRKALVSLLALLWNSAFMMSVCPSTPPACRPHFPQSIFFYPTEGNKFYLFILPSDMFMADFLHALGLPDGSVVQNLPDSHDTWVQSLGQKFSKGEGNSNPLQYSCLGNSVARGAWQATAHGATKRQIRLSDWHFHFHFSMCKALLLVLENI